MTATATQRLMTKLANMARARVKLGPPSCFVRQRVVVPIVLANPVTQCPIRARDSELLDPAVLIRGDGLAGQLPSKPLVLLRQEDAAAPA